MDALPARGLAVGGDGPRVKLNSIDARSMAELAVGRIRSIDLRIDSGCIQDELGSTDVGLELLSAFHAQLEVEVDAFSEGVLCGSGGTWLG